MRGKTCVQFSRSSVSFSEIYSSADRDKSLSKNFSSGNSLSMTGQLWAAFSVSSHIPSSSRRLRSQYNRNRYHVRRLL